MYRSGLERLLSEEYDRIAGKTVGVITNHTGVTGEMVLNFEVVSSREPIFPKDAVLQIPSSSWVLLGLILFAWSESWGTKNSLACSLGLLTLVPHSRSMRARNVVECKSLSLTGRALTAA